MTELLRTYIEKKEIKLLKKIQRALLQNDFVKILSKVFFNPHTQRELRAAIDFAEIFFQKNKNVDLKILFLLMIDLDKDCSSGCF
jgi:hypothetical protein